MNEQIEAIRNEIKRLEEIHERNLKKPMERGRIGFAHGVVECCDRILSFIDSIEKQPETEIFPRCKYYNKKDGYCYEPHGGLQSKINENGVYDCTGFIDSLPEETDNEEPNCPKLSDNLEEAAGVKETPINLDDEIVEYWKVMEWSKSIPLSKFKVIARYFYGLGLAARLKITMAEDKEVKSAAVTTADRLLANPKDYALSAKADYWNGSYEGFIAGAQWQKDTVNIDISKQIAIAFQLGGKDKEEQMMKEAVEGEVADLNGDIYNYCIEKGMTDEDKVRIIIVKEDEL